MGKDAKNEGKTWTDPVTGKFAKGNPGGGRPSGSLDFRTKWYNLIDKLAKQNNVDPLEVEQQLLLVGYRKAKEGDYSFYRDIMDRVYGKPVQHSEISGKDGQPIVFIPTEMIDKYKLDNAAHADTEPSSQGQPPLPSN